MIFLLLMSTFPLLSGKTLMECEFENDTCKWTSLSQGIDSKFTFHRVTSEYLLHSQEEGPTTDHQNDPNQHFLIVQASSGHHYGDIAQFKSPSNLEGKGCLNFVFSFTSYEGIHILMVKSVDEKSREKILWELRETDNFEINSWNHAAVLIESPSIFSQHVSIVFEVIRNDMGSGYAAIDALQLSSDNCNTYPPNAIPDPSPSPGTFNCDFNDNNCNWQNTFWIRTSGNSFNNSLNAGPSSDHLGISDSFYMIASSEFIEYEGEVAVLQTPSFPPKQSFCLHFYFTVSGIGLRQLNIYLVSEISLHRLHYWSLQSSDVENNTEWIEAQFYIDVPFSYKIRIMAQRGNGPFGYIAIDDFTFSNRSDCSFYPSMAVNPQDLSCTFEEESLCGWENSGEMDFKFTRVTGEEILLSQTTGPTHDHFYNTKNYFLNVVSSSKVDSKAFLSSPNIETSNYPSLCFNFYYSFKGNGIEGLLIKIISSTGKNEETSNYIWELMQPSGLSWHPGRIYIPPNVSNSTIKIVFSALQGTKVEGYVAVDDFHFLVDKDSESCSTLPQNAAPEGSALNSNFENINNYEVSMSHQNFSFKRQTATELMAQGVEGPLKDIYNSTEGHFMFIRSGGIFGSSAILQSLPISSEFDSFLCLSFYYDFLTKGGIANFQILLYDLLLETSTVFWKSSGSVTGWTKGQVQLRASTLIYDDYIVLFDVIAGNPAQSGFLAIDEIFAYKTNDCSILPSENSPLCKSNEFTCVSNGKCIPQESECNFIADCEDKSDEETCPSFTLFSHCSASCELNGLCCFHDASSSEFLYWRLVNASELSISLSVFNSFRVLQLYGATGSGNYESMSSVLLSPLYHDSSPTCSLVLNLALLGDLNNSRLVISLLIPSSSSITYPLFYVEENRNMTLTPPIQLGRISSDFQLSIYKEENKFFNAIIAIESFWLLQCAYGEKFEFSCPSGKDFHCDNKRCIENNVICDLTDDCGDYSDERNCGIQNFELFDFEDPVPWGLFPPFQEGPWKRSYGFSLAGKPPTQPLIDHTYFNDKGHYLFVSHIDAQSSYRLKSIQIDVLSSCRLRFYYYMSISSSVNILTLRMITNDKQEIELWKSKDEKRNFYNRQEILITQSGSIHLVFEAVFNLNSKGYMALDDISLSPGCKLYTQENCDDSQFRCKLSNKCINKTLECNFNYDCAFFDSEDDSDESLCPSVFNFKNCDTLEICHWYNFISDELDWILTSGRNLVSTEYGENGPTENSIGDSESNFMYLKDDGGSRSNVFSSNAMVFGPSYKDSNAQCTLSFYYYVHSDEEPLISILRDERKNVFLTLDIYHSTHKSWKKAVIGLGRRPHEFAIGFNIESRESTKGSVAIDQISFTSCGFEKSEKPCQSFEFTCLSTHNCISSSQLCDLSLDCQDGSDEIHCSQYLTMTLEDSVILFSSNPTSSREWLHGKGSQSPFNNAPFFDHTLLDSGGTFLYVRSSELSDWGDVARLESVTFEPSSKCVLFFWYFNYGDGEIKIQLKDEKGNINPLLSLSVNEENAWKKAILNIFHTEGEFTILIDGILGRDFNNSKIALDDISLHENCILKYPFSCSDNMFSCISGACISKDSVCDLRSDCSQSEDERICPNSFTFNSCSTLTDCGLSSEDPTSKSGFQIFNANTLSIEGYSAHGPFSGPSGNKSDNFLFLVNSSIIETVLGEFHTSHPYHNSGPYCKLRMNLYMSETLTGTLTPYIFHSVLNQQETLDTLSEPCETDLCDWKSLAIGVGRHRNEFKIGFTFSGKEGLTGSLAIDDIRFEDCTFPVEGADCSPEEFQCKQSKACIHQDLLCDLSDDCGDESDEFNTLCQSFKKYSFELLAFPFEPFEVHGFNWKVGTGSMNSGPSLDHTFSDSKGHYLYFSASVKLSSDLISYSFDPSSNCILTYYYYYRGNNALILRTLLKTLDSYEGQEQPLLNINESKGHFWLKERLSLTTKKPFEVILRAETVKISDSSFIAIDDVIFSPECKKRIFPSTTASSSYSSSSSSSTLSTLLSSTSTNTETFYSTPNEIPVTPKDVDYTHHSLLVILLPIAILIIITLVLSGLFLNWKQRLQRLPTWSQMKSFINPTYDESNNDFPLSLMNKNHERLGSISGK